MHGLYIEKHSLERTLPYDLVCHISAHTNQGKVAVVCGKPGILLLAVRKQWAKRMQRLQRDRSGMLDSAKLAELSGRLAWMEGLRFSAKPPNDQLEADVTFATAESFVMVPPVCSTIYVTYKFEREKLYMLTSWMPKGGVVVVYEQD